MEKLCPKCNAQVSESYNYCPLCGEPLTPLAKQHEELKLASAGYDKLNELANYTKDPVVLDTIKKMMFDK